MTTLDPNIILSLHPEWWPRILSGEKTLEIRKTAPHPVYFPLRVVVYLTVPVCRVVGEFTCNSARKIRDNYEDIAAESCLQPHQLRDYADGKLLRAWEVSHPMQYGKPRRIEDYGMKRPPQSWRYLEKSMVPIEGDTAIGNLRGMEVQRMKPIYEPKGKAKEYGDLAINIYTGCPHHCFYCFGPAVLHRDREEFHCHVEPRPGIVEAVKKQLHNERITGKLIHLCFTCDPYPRGYDTSATREIIEALKNSGNHVQILTKNDGSRDFDLLDKDDWYGVTFTGASHSQEPGAIIGWSRIRILVMAKHMGISTWVSCEPVIDDSEVLKFLQYAEYVDKIKIGKLNYHPSDIDWGEFGHAAESICKSRGLNYYIKESLRAEMECDK